MHKYLTDPAEIRAALATAERDHPDVFAFFNRRLTLEEVVTGEDRQGRTWFLLEKDDDDDWRLRNPRAGATLEEAAEAHDRLLYHRIAAELEEREQRARTLEQAIQLCPPDRLRSLLTIGMAMLQDTFDWEAHERASEQDETLPESLDDVWRVVTGLVLDDDRWTFPVPLRGCGSTRLSGARLRLRGTPGSFLPALAFYRMLYRMRPRKVDLSDLYNTSVCGVVSADLRFAAVLETYKFEPCLRFYCHGSVFVDEQEGRDLRISSGIPGIDLGTRCTDAVGNLWFQFIKTCAETSTMIYGGNDFEV